MTVLADAAAADPAPIVFAARETDTATANPPVLAGGGDTSYGYGRAEGARGAVIDIRRNTGAPTPAPIQPATPAPEQPALAGRPDASAEWLEHEQVGPPYQANGAWYVPTPEPGYSETGTASWYGPNFHGQLTATGDVFDETALTAAHPTLPIPSLVQVTNLDNGREVIVRVNDRGPFVGGRIIDLSRAAANVLGFEQSGQARVHVRYLGPAPRHVNADSAPAPDANVASDSEPHDGPRSLLPVSIAPAAPVASAPASGGYFVQVGAFSDLSNAHRVRDQVAAAGPVDVDIRERAGGELFRVRVGPLASRAEAEDAQRALDALGFRDSLIGGP
jgi:rare lipoprotein A